MIVNSDTKDGKELYNLTKSYADQKIYTTFIGLGIDFNSNLVCYHKPTGITHNYQRSLNSIRSELPITLVSNQPKNSRKIWKLILIIW